jgi:hypothetical protein
MHPPDRPKARLAPVVDRLPNVHMADLHFYPANTLNRCFCYNQCISDSLSSFGGEGWGEEAPLRDPCPTQQTHGTPQTKP